MAFFTVQQIQPYLGALPPEQATMLPHVLAAISADFQSRSGWMYLEPTVATLNYVGDGTNDIIFDCALLDLDTLTVEGDEWVEGTQYWLYPTNYTRKRFVRFQNAPAGTIAVTGTWGFGDAPADLIMAVADAVASVIATRSTSIEAGALKSVEQGDVKLEFASTTLGTDLSRVPSYVKALKRYTFRRF